MPWPCTFEDSLSGVDITISDIATERTDMGSHRQGFLHDLPTFVAFLRGETRVHSDHLMTSSLSLLFKDSEECAPTSVHDALCQGMILYHVENSQLLNRDQLIAFCILFGCLIVKVSALTGNLEMGLCRTTSSLTASVTSFFAPTQSALFASQRLLSQHLVKELARLSQTSREPTGLFLIRIQSKLKRSHILIIAIRERNINSFIPS